MKSYYTLEEIKQNIAIKGQIIDLRRRLKKTPAEICKVMNLGKCHDNICKFLEGRGLLDIDSMIPNQKQRKRIVRALEASKVPNITIIAYNTNVLVSEVKNRS